MYDTTNNISCGSNNIQDCIDGFVSYARHCGNKTIKDNGVKNNPSVSWIKTRLQNNQPILMGYEINVQGEASGHAISVLGYIRATKISSGNTWNYLKVYNGWNNYPCHLNYSTVDFNEWQATYF